MTTLTNFIVNPALYQSVGIEAQAGDQVELFLDQTIADPDLPTSIIGTIQPGMTRTCAGTSYDIAYDETDLDESGVDLLTPDMVLSAEIVSEAQVLFANCVRFDAEQSLTAEQQDRARLNIGAITLNPPPFTTQPTTMYPIDGVILEFTLASDDLAINDTGIYTYLGEVNGAAVFKQTGASLTITDGIITGSGRAFFVSTETVDCPRWTLALFTVDVPDVIAIQYNPNQQFITSPHLVFVWNDAVTEEPVELTFSDVDEQSANVNGVPGDIAFGYTQFRWEVFMCYQNHPTRWRQVSFNVNTLPA